MAEDDHPSAEPAGFQSSRPTLAPERLRGLLADSARRERSSARILRASGNETAARRAERAATRIELTMEEPQSVHRMYAFARHLSGASHHQELLTRALQGALALLGADLGNIQLRDPRTGVLRIVTQHGFSPEFVAHFARVDDASTACGRAAGRGTPSFIVDVDTDPEFAPHRSIAATSGFRAVQSTPLIDRTGHVRGVLSTHFRQPHRPRPHELQIMAWYGELVAAAVVTQQSTPRLLYLAAAACHDGAAERHAAVAPLLHACADWFSVRGSGANATEAKMYAREAETRALRERQRGRTGRRLAERTGAAETATGPG